MSIIYYNLKPNKFLLKWGFYFITESLHLIFPLLSILFQDTFLCIRGKTFMCLYSGSASPVLLKHSVKYVFLHGGIMQAPVTSYDFMGGKLKSSSCVNMTRKTWTSFIHPTSTFHFSWMKHKEPPPGGSSSLFPKK